ncbi:hypothetical protein RTBOTA2_002536 [Rhodotorula toruloides]|nr:hypothetical protein RTBOTA2_002536 [Rhodotorula toruloides]
MSTSRLISRQYEQSPSPRYNIRPACRWLARAGGCRLAGGSADGEKTTRQMSNHLA